MSAKKLWVGQFEEKSLVYDPDIQLIDCTHLFLWDPEINEMRKYIAELARDYIKPHENLLVAAAHISAYEVWKLAHIEAWMNDTKQYYEGRRVHEEALEVERRLHEEAREAARRARELALEEKRLLASLSPEERHKRRLKELGKTYSGVRAATQERPRRVTHCYSCNTGLDNSIDVECVACGWILCICGACGCGYSP